MKIITVANFRSGGKSSVARLLAESIGTSILNFDSNRNAEHYNAINTYNVNKNKEISREAECLILSDDNEELQISSKSGYLICDLGGYVDPRVIDLKSDYYILPSFHDYESIHETMRCALYILKHQPRAQIILILNGGFLRTTKEREKYLYNWNEQIELNGLTRFENIYLPNSSLMARLVDDEVKKEDVKTKNGVKISYKNVDGPIKQLLDILKD